MHRHVGGRCCYVWSCCSLGPDLPEATLVFLIHTKYGTFSLNFRHFLTYFPLLAAAFLLHNVLWHIITAVSLTGARLSGGHSLHETSSVLVETVTKTTKVGGAYSSSSSTSSTKLTSDASKVVCRGAGLSKALVGQKNNFTVDCSKAGESITEIQKEKIKSLFPQMQEIKAILSFCCIVSGGTSRYYFVRKRWQICTSRKHATNLAFICSLVSGQRVSLGHAQPLQEVAIFPHTETAFNKHVESWRTERLKLYVFTT